jgi:hypothetical protein
MKGFLLALGMLAMTTSCSQPGKDAGWCGFNAPRGAVTCATDADCRAGNECELGREQDASLGWCKAHASAASKADHINERRSRRDRPRRRAT